ncbi:MAG: carboxypeptidase regulatory-like domain-containing protein, partial [Phycisphaeraceae bacterium]|nr:carboxypeptidase regulatory-like domain-containing protein [Phycisphaeraceae bacterium]
MKTRRCLGLFMLGLCAFSFFFSFSLGLASGEKSAAKRPAALRSIGRVGVTLEVSGVVLDSQSNPISEVSVFAWNSGKRVYAETDKTGRFRLPNMSIQSRNVYARADGFRFCGITIKPGAKDIRIKLIRSGEPATRVMQTLPDLPSLEQAYDSLSNHFGPFAKKCIAAAEKTDRLRPLEVLACVEPAWVLQYLQTNPFEEAWFNDYVRWAAAEVLLDQNMDDALAIVHSLESPMWRSMGCTKIVDALTDTQQARKLSLLAEALLQAHAVEAPDKQLATLSVIAGQFLDLGQTEQATRILQEGHRTAKTLPTKEWPGYARGGLAEVLARIDLKSAMALVTGYEDDFDHDRHHGNIAHKLAATDPANAQRVLNMMRTKRNRERWSS